MRHPTGRSATVAILGLLLLVVSPAPPAAARQSAAPAESTSDWVQVSAGGYHTCGIRTSGRLYCWGTDGNGELGDGGAVNTDQPEPVEVAGNRTNWTSVSAGFDHTCARRATGRIYCWGSDTTGQLGNGSAVNTQRRAPVLVAGGATDWTAVSAGYDHTCGRRSTGRIYCWGNDGTGELGDGGAVNTTRFAPRLVAGGATNWTSVSAGGDYTCGRRATGRIYCWGADSTGQLGNGPVSTGERHVPALVAGGATTWTSVSTGGGSTPCGRRSTGRIYCWGADHNGQIGDGGTNTAQDHPSLVAGGATTWSAVSGGSSPCGRRNTGQLFCWGYDFYGQLGDGGTNTSQPEPVEVAGAATDWAAVTIGNGHACARKSTGQLFCWGFDAFGQLGDGGTNADQPEPVEVA